EEAINECLKTYREYIGKENVFVSPEEGVAFLIGEPFDAKLASNAYFKQTWAKQHEKLCTEIADFEGKLAEWRTLPDDEIVGNKEADPAIRRAMGGDNRPIAIKAKEA